MELINMPEMKVVCPFRTLTITSQLSSQMMEQRVNFPECHYGECPFYRPDGKNPQEKCGRANAVNNIVM